MNIPSWAEYIGTSKTGNGNKVVYLSSDKFQMEDYQGGLVQSNHWPISTWSNGAWNVKKIDWNMENV